MKKIYFRGALLLGAAAVMGTMSMSAQTEAGAWRNINHLVKNVSGIEGWSGVATGADAAAKVGEIFYSAGLIYYVVPDAPEGQYTLTANAFYRAADAPSAATARKNGKETVNAKLFIDDSEAAIKSLFDGAEDEKALFDAEGNYVWGLVPNSLAEARTAFDAGKYANTITANHAGGDLYIGLRNYGNPDGLDEWTAFADFKLTGPKGEVTLPAIADFSKDAGWDVRNKDLGNKGRGLQNGGVWSKTNASIYNHAQTIENLPAGKYRFVVNAFNCHFLGSHNGYYIPMKGAFEEKVGKSAKDMYEEGAKEYPAGQVKGGEEYNPSMYYPVEALEAYVFMNVGVKRPGGFDEGEYYNYWMEEYEDINGVHYPEMAAGQAIEKKVKNLFEENLAEYPDANNYKVDGKWRYTDGEGNPIWWESGNNREAAALFVAHPELYLNIVELELTEESNTLTFGIRKDVNQNNYWQPYFDVRLERWDPEYKGYTPSAGISDIVADNEEDAPVEYYNLQGMRVNNPACGIYIVKQGKKVSKQLFK